MAYDDELAKRIRQVVQGERGLSEMRMFGGLAFMVHGDMAASASSQGGLLLRIDPAQAESLVSKARAAFRDARPGDERLAPRRRSGGQDRRGTPTLGQSWRYLRAITSAEVVRSRRWQRAHAEIPTCREMLVRTMWP